jgi:hypothetical protein
MSFCGSAQLPQGHYFQWRFFRLYNRPSVVKALSLMATSVLLHGAGMLHFAHMPPLSVLLDFPLWLPTR